MNITNKSFDRIVWCPFCKHSCQMRAYSVNNALYFCYNDKCIFNVMGCVEIIADDNEILFLSFHTEKFAVKINYKYWEFPYAGVWLEECHVMMLSSHQTFKFSADLLPMNILPDISAAGLDNKISNILIYQ